MLSRCLGRAAPLLAFCSLAFAQTGEDAVVVTASRTEQRVRDTIPHTTVLTRKEIQDSQAVDLPTILRREAGVEVVQDGGLGQTARLSIRGSRTAQVLVLIDGVRVEDSASSTTALQHLMLDDIERIEVVRGNVSSLYGSNAMGGVVQVFTRRGTGAPAPYGELTAGSHDTTKLLAGYGGEFGDTRLNVSVLRLDTRGFSAIDPRFAPNANPDDDGYRNESITASIAHRLGHSHEIGVRLLRTRTKVDYDDGTSSIFVLPTDVHNADQDLGMTQLYWDAQLLERWKSRITAAEGTDYRTDFFNGAFSFSSNTRSRQLIWDNEVRIAPLHTLSLAADRLEQDLDSSFAGQQKRDVNGARLGYLGRLGSHSLQVNARYEDYSDFGHADTYYLGYGFDLTEAWRLTASAGTAFRAPNFADLFGVPGFSLPNPDLRPERSRTYELGVQWARAGQRVRVVAFNTEFKDEIVFMANQSQNLEKGTVNGVESSYSGRFAGTDLTAAVTVQDVVEQLAGGTEQAGLRRAKAYGSISAFRSFSRWRLGGELLTSGSRPDVNVADTRQRVEVPGYAVLNLLARFNFNKNLFMAARLENALDKEYQLVHGFNTAPRGIFVTVGWQP
jgi:vitamin B12 transporter